MKLRFTLFDGVCLYKVSLLRLLHFSALEGAFKEREHFGIK
jgi:hypothetical protein